jgi:hypothetical protein
VQLSLLGLILGGAYLAFALLLMGRVVAKNSFGGLFSEEFPLAVFTLPFSYLGEAISLFRRGKYARLGLYFVAALLNASGLYFLGMGIAGAVRWMAAGPS